MNREILYQHSQEYAILRDELRLAHGPYANKRSLQEVSLHGGVPVHPLISEEVAIQMLRAGLPENCEIFLRGLYDASEEMWSVDMLPTYETHSREDLERRKRQFAESASDPALTGFVQRNISVEDLGSPQYFLQLGDPGSVYFTTLTYGPYTFLSANTIGMERGVNWKTYYEGEVIMGEHWHYGPSHQKRVLAIADQAQRVLNDAFIQRRSDFEYKHDIIFSPHNSTYTLVQSRVASRKMTHDDIAVQEAWIDHQVASGMPVISCEPSGIGGLGVDRSPQLPFILQLTNDKHKGAATRKEYLQMDLSRMVGLILPRYLRGGLLQHSGYGIIAIALKLGLPISFSA